MIKEIQKTVWVTSDGVEHRYLTEARSHEACIQVTRKLLKIHDFRIICSDPQKAAKMILRSRDTLVKIFDQFDDDTIGKEDFDDAD